MSYSKSTTKEITAYEAAKIVVADHLKANFFADNAFAEMVDNCEHLITAELSDEEYEELVKIVEKLINKLLFDLKSMEQATD